VSRPRSDMRVAIDTGGTFTDCVYLDGGAPRVLKLLSTPHDPGVAIEQGLAAVAQAAPPTEVRHGTTVGTNTLLERSGARVAFVTTAGFEDTIAIGRQARPHLYRWSNPPAAPLAPEGLRFGVAERTLPAGEIAQPASAAELRRLFRDLAAAAPEAVAVSLLFSFANPANERAVGAALEELGVPVSLSHQILPEFREYERGAAVLINAYLAPRMGRYLNGLQLRLGKRYPKARLHVMQSSGGIISAAVAAREPVRTILSGPAGGVVGAWRVAQQAGCDRILTFDMGGTSTDVALVDGREARARAEGGALRTARDAHIVGLPVGVPMLDIHTVGAGGGSLAGFDRAGALTVGPQSAGADPGPIAYGRGERPTVTDANLLLGRLDPRGLLGGGLRLDEERVRRCFARAKGPLATVEGFAAGIVRMAEAHMEKALRRISVERGYDPREFTLVSFGGAGPLHACALAEGLEMARVLVPVLPGALSALGILMSDMVKDYSRTIMEPVGADTERRLAAYFRALEREGAADLRAEGWRGVARRELDVRYAGQGFELRLDAGPGFVARFHRLHRRRYGYADERRPLEIVNARVRLIAPSPPLALPRQRPRPGNGGEALRERRRAWFNGRPRSTPVYERERLRPGDAFSGPAIVSEYSATTVVPPRWRARVDAGGNLILERT
jgi:N-methylhydantoinase A